jgi:hypothetical protein
MTALRSPIRVRPGRPAKVSRLPSRSAARRAFSLTFPVTQRDAVYRRSPMPTVDLRRRDRSGGRRRRSARRCCERTGWPPPLDSAWPGAPYGAEAVASRARLSARRLSAGGGGQGAHWDGADYRPGPARLCPSRRRRRARRRAGCPGQRACRGWPGHGSCPSRGGHRVWCPPSCGDAGCGAVKPDEDHGCGGCRSGCSRSATGAVTTAGSLVRRDDRHRRECDLYADVLASHRA